MGRTPIVAGNWKMNLTRAESLTLAREVVASCQDLNDVEIAIFPAVLWTDAVAAEVGDSSIQVGVQDCYVEESGAFTGEVSPIASASICQAALAGHSERRHVLGESDELVSAKLSAILSAGMTGYLCVGETIDERQSGDTELIVGRQLEASLAKLDANELTKLVIAYEPVWAIGTGEAATQQDAQEMCQFVRRWIGNKFGDAGHSVRVLYGGSVSPQNAQTYFEQSDIDGALVGGASLKIDSFAQIARIAARVTI